MSCRLLLILLVIAATTDLACSTPKLFHRGSRLYERSKLWARQGLPESVEDVADTENPEKQQGMMGNDNQNVDNLSNEGTDMADGDNDNNDDNDYNGDNGNNGDNGDNGDNDDYDNGDNGGNDYNSDNGNNNDYGDNGGNGDNDGNDASGDNGDNESELYKDAQEENDNYNDGNADAEENPEEDQYDNDETEYNQDNAYGNDQQQYYDNPNDNNYYSTYPDYENYYEENSLGYMDEVEDFDAKNGYEDLSPASYEYYDDVLNLKLKEDSRALQVGDTFTAQEMLPIAAKLLQKVKKTKKKGNGIISSATRPRNLADVLFERYFMSLKRIVILNEIDLPGLDALQALALSGEVVGLRSGANSVTETPENKSGKHLIEKKPIFKCHYKLIRKRMGGNGRIPALKRNAKRRRVDLSKKLAKNRKLVVNPARRRPMMKHKNQKSKQPNKMNEKKPNIRINNRAHPSQKKKNTNSTNVSTGSESKKKDLLCRWRYECKNRTDLGTCRLHPDCSENVTSSNYLGLTLNADTEKSKQFRRMESVGDLDGEVEKILEQRVLALRPKLYPNEVIESLSQYFNKIVVREQIDEQNTSPNPLAAPIDKPVTPDEDSTVTIRQIANTESYNDYDAHGSPQDGTDYTQPNENDESEVPEEVQPENESEPQNYEEAQTENKGESQPETEGEPSKDYESGTYVPENEDTQQNDTDLPENIEEFTPEPVEEQDSKDSDMNTDNELVSVPEAGDSDLVTEAIESRRILPGILTTRKSTKE